VAENEPGGWLLLIHQIPPKPDYFRVKVWRRLQRLGAVAIKNSVYALPQSDRALEDFQWVLREIIEGGGDGSVCAARFVDGLTDQQIEALFHAARDAEYAALAEEARALADRAPRGRRTAADHVAQLTAQVGRLRRRLGEIVALDVLGAPGREAAEGLVGGLEATLRRAAQPARAATKMGGAGARLQRRTWVTRSGVHVDRMASAWLIRRFIDPKARFKFVAAKGYVAKAGELRFDMFEAEYTHEGDRCTFEVLVGRAGVRDAALQPIAEIVHDIDLKDAKYRRPEAAGIDRLIAGIAMGTKDDEERVRAAATVWDGLYEYFRRKPG
jgi:hypothetical protein